MKNRINPRKIVLFLGLFAANLLVALLAALLLLKTPAIVGVAGLILFFFATFYIPNWFYRGRPLVIAGFRAGILVLTGYASVLFLRGANNSDEGILLFVVFVLFALIVGAKTIYDVVVYFSRDS